MAVTPLPSLDRSSPTFRADVDTFFATQLPTFSTEVNTVATDATTQASTATAQAVIATQQAVLAAQAKVASEAARDLSLQYSEEAAQAAAVSGTAPVWTAGSYTAGQVRYSPITFFTYRAKTTFTSSVDPSLDSVNWMSLSGSQAKIMYLAFS